MSDNHSTATVTTPVCLSNRCSQKTLSSTMEDLGITPQHNEQLKQMINDPRTQFFGQRLKTLVTYSKVVKQEEDAYLKPIYERFDIPYENTQPHINNEPVNRPLDKETVQPLPVRAVNMTLFKAECDAAHQKHGYYLRSGENPIVLADRAVERATEDFLKHGNRYLGVENDGNHIAQQRFRALFLRFVLAHENHAALT